ncbi:hypothetical protein [Novosphingobium album (ex Liu et al. 2023)]|uniref:DUF4148 domain-containing protein n=1 Tax=Novosphingobium album (ex Liu et al. 2023) TaxID=3031130 RepID=A0ABT5WT41_9SPHN|nr:hypothetical protein [Novosphingobium album (ex Liu et al. 2023)]MDE8653084.1 hypothetical protein [Novosphingobium album (ex Liu et al. 2023)]
MPQFTVKSLTRIVAPALVAALGLGAAMPATAFAADRHTPVRNAAIRTDINDLNRDIDRAAARRTISAREAASLKRDASQVRYLYGQYSRNGLTVAETRTLQARVDRIHIALRAERRDRDGHRG